MKYYEYKVVEFLCDTRREEHLNFLAQAGWRLVRCSDRYTKSGVSRTTPGEFFETIWERETSPPKEDANEAV